MARWKRTDDEDPEEVALQAVLAYYQDRRRTIPPWTSPTQDRRRLKELEAMVDARHPEALRFLNET